jgi:hypothetical protein
MYNQYSAIAGSPYDSYQLSTPSKTNSTNRFEQTFPFDRSRDLKAVGWNIEESKENLTLYKDRPFTSNNSHYSKTEFTGYPSTNYNIKKSGESYLSDYSRSKLSKSSKNIKFSD